MPTDAQLLAAARQAYRITRDGPVPNDPDTPPLAVGYGTPQGFISGMDRIDACLFGRSDDAIIVAFRGTQPPVPGPRPLSVLLDWLNDANAALEHADAYTGLVHRGFKRSIAALWDELDGPLLAMARAHPELPIYTTGHSKGGPLANLAALRLRSELGTPGRVRVRTFAAARTGDADFAAAYDAAIPDSIRYEYADDLVPHVPPDQEFRDLLNGDIILSHLLDMPELAYRSVGTLRYIPRHGAFVPDSPGLARQRRDSFLDTLTGSLHGAATIVSDHGIAHGSGYANGVP